MFYCQRNSAFTWFALVLMLIPFAAVSDQHKGSESHADIKLLVLGDSLSAAYGLKAPEGWVSLLQNMWEENHSGIYVVNAAISGETTDGGLARLPRLLAQHQPTHLLIELGGNDGLQGHNVNKLRVNLRNMVDIAHGAGVEVFIQEMQIPTNYGRRYNKLFTESFAMIAEEKDIPLVPFFLADVALDSSLMQRDGIHPNAKAQPKIAEFMRRELEKILF